MTSDISVQTLAQRYGRQGRTDRMKRYVGDPCAGEARNTQNQIMRRRRPCMKKGQAGQAVVSETSSGSGSGADSVGTRDYGKQPLVCAGCGASGCSRQCRRCNDLLCQDCINGYDICFMCAGATTSASSGPVCAHSMDAEGWRARHEVQDVEGLLEG